MKKIISLLLAAALCTATAACTMSGDPSQEGSVSSASVSTASASAAFVSAAAASAENLCFGRAKLAGQSDCLSEIRINRIKGNIAHAVSAENDDKQDQAIAKRPAHCQRPRGKPLSRADPALL